MNSETSQKYLPIGTVCMLNGGQKSIMITGFCPINTEEEKIYDYIGVVYPLGQIVTSITLMFDHSQIAKILYMGYSNEEDKEFKKELEIYANIDGKELYKKVSSMLSEQQAEESLPKETETPQVEAVPGQISTPLVDTSSQINN